MSALAEWLVSGGRFAPFLRVGGLVFSAFIGWAAANIVAQLGVNVLNTFLG